MSTTESKKKKKKRPKNTMYLVSCKKVCFNFKMKNHLFNVCLMHIDREKVKRKN